MYLRKVLQSLTWNSLVQLSRSRRRLRRRPNDAPFYLVAEVLAPRELLSVTLSVSNPIPLPEGDSGTSNMVFVVTRSGDTSLDVQANYQTYNGTAIAGTDYTETSGTLDFLPGVTSLTVNVPVIGNTIFQSDRTFSLQVFNTPSFAAQETFATGTSPRSVTSVDVNGDGRLDLVVANISSATVSVLLDTTAPGDTSPSFAAQESFATGSGPISVSSADVNGDGRPDLVVANYGSYTVSVLVNTTAAGATTPSFAAQETFATGAGPRSVTSVDVNGDGRSDLVVANFGSDTVSVLLNTTAAGATTPSFAAQETFATGTGPRSVTGVDVNGDGRPDLVVANFSSDTVSVLLDTTAPGAGTPSFASQLAFATGSQPFSVTGSDVNGDGRPDLVVANANSSTVSVLLDTTAPGAATPTFAAQQMFAAGTVPSAVTSVDVNLDGRPDLVVANQFSDTMSVLLNTTAAGATTLTFAAQQTLATGPRPYSVTSADVNGDGRPDLVVANLDSNTLSVLLNTTALGTDAASFGAQQAFAAGNTPSVVVTGDINGDGRPDLVITNLFGNTLSVLLNTTAPGATTPSFAAQQEFDAGPTPYTVIRVDVNGDGRPDIVLTNLSWNTVSVLINTTAPGADTVSFADRKEFPTGYYPNSVTSSDVNGDGLPDLVVTDQSADTLSVLLNTTVLGSNTPSFAAHQTFATGTQPVGVTSADINNDGRLDFVVANTASDTVSVLLNTTVLGSNTVSLTTQQTFATESRPFLVVGVDVNGDGRTDLAVSNFGSDSVSVLLNTTVPGSDTPSFAEQQAFATGTNPFPLTSSDVNGDGRPDLIVANYHADTVSVLLNTTPAGADTPSFAAQQVFATGKQPAGVSCVDVNGDGRPDLIVTNFYSNTVSVLLDTSVPIATGTIQDDDAPVSVTAADGTTPQSTLINTDFATNLAVAVENAAGHLVSNVSVTFAAPNSGATGVFGASATVLTDSSGIATAPTFTANGTIGGYAVTATATGGVDPFASFNLTNQTTPTVTVTDGGIYTGSTQNAIGTALGVDGETPVSGTFAYTYFASDGSTVLGSAPKDAGSYYVTAVFTSSDSSYVNASSPKTSFSITTASLTITAKNQTQTYGFGGTSASLGTTAFTTSGLVNDETVGGVTLTTNDTLSGSSNYIVGTFTLTPSDATGGTFNPIDYTIVYNNAPTGLTVNQLTLTVSATGDNKVYDGTTVATVTLSDNHLSGDTVQDVYTSASFADPNVGTGKSVSVTGVSISGADAANYEANTTADTKANITPATATISVTGYSVTYNGNPHTATGTATGVGGVDLSVDLDLTGTTHTDAGTYNGDAWSFHDADGNYADANGTVDDLINKADATVVVTPYTVTYDGNAHTATVT
ncbi:MAG: VCBS repeat-containing protein, partial [Planctomycetes bacterium]|nr:VCBS repeat-containing protein [Planctomycetota bacterium]